MATKQKANREPKRADIELLLESSRKEDHINGLNLAAVAMDYGLLYPVMMLAKSQDPEVYDMAVLVAVSLARNCLLETDRRIGGLATEWAAIAIKRYCPEFIQETYHGLRSENPDVIIPNLCAIRHFLSQNESLDMLRYFLKHPDERVRATACTQVGLEASQASMGILTVALDDSDDRVKANIIELMESVSPGRFVPIFEKFRYDRNNRIRANALKALCTAGRTDTAEDFEAMLNHPTPLMRASAVWAIGEIGNLDKCFTKLLKIVVNDEDKMVLDNLVLALRKLGRLKRLVFLKKPLLKRHPQLKQDPFFKAW